MKRGFYNCKFVLVAVAAAVAVGAEADDAAGVMRASASNDSAVVVMPFSPFATDLPYATPYDITATWSETNSFDLHVEKCE